MRKKMLLILYGLGIAAFGVAQHAHLSVITPYGGTSQAGDIVFDWSLGEPLIESVYSADRIYSQGFHQPMIQVAEISDPVDLRSPRTDDAAGQQDFEITVVPNPVKATLTINWNGLADHEVEIHMHDATGQAVITKSADPGSSTTLIDVRQLPAGLYVLRVFGPERQLLQSFKVTKVQ